MRISLWRYEGGKCTAHTPRLPYRSADDGAKYHPISPMGDIVYVQLCKFFSCMESLASKHQFSKIRDKTNQTTTEVRCSAARAGVNRNQHRAGSDAGARRVVNAAALLEASCVHINFVPGNPQTDTLQEQTIRQGRCVVYPAAHHGVMAASFGLFSVR